MLFVFASTNLLAQVENTGMTDRQDSLELGKVKISGYVDVYYGFDFNEPLNSDRPYSVSSPRHNEINVNLAYVDFKYQNDKIRARFVPGVGTYINSNYASESGSLKGIVEANVGVKLHKSKEIWVDAGIMGAPFTNESAVSKDHLMYTRSFSAEYSPYYITGVRLTYPINEKFCTYAYVINGWQQISDVNNPLSVAGQLEYKPTNNLLVNYNFYIGSEQSLQNPNFGNRYFNDLYFIYKSSKKISFTSNVYYGLQSSKNTLNQQTSLLPWYQGNFIARYALGNETSVSGRIEYFEDLNKIVIQPETSSPGFSTFSAGLCFDKKFGKHAMFRLEGRHYFSEQNIYLNSKQNPTNSDNLLIASLSAWF